MDVMEAILTRRSIRKYTQEPVPETTVKELLEAAMNAPSAGNKQPWQFVLITDRSILDGISLLNTNWQMLRQAPLVVTVCGDLRLEKREGVCIQDCAAATQNLLVAAHAKGLGAVWLGIYPGKEWGTFLKNMIGLPDAVIPLSLIPIGYPMERKSPAKRYDESRVHYDQW
jgi:nitroreductase